MQEPGEAGTDQTAYVECKPLFALEARADGPTAGDVEGHSSAHYCYYCVLFAVLCFASLRFGPSLSMNMMQLFCSVGLLFGFELEQ